MAAAIAIPTAILRTSAVCSAFTLPDGMASYSNGVFGGLNRLLAFAVLASAFVVLPLAVPPAALADCNGGVSAVNVYSECGQTGGGGKSTKSGSGSHTAGGTQTSGGPSSTTVVHVSKTTAKKLNRAGKDGKSLKHLVNFYDAPPRVLQSSSAPTSDPTAVGSAFDLGSGPTALLIVLAGTAILLLGVSGFRAVRHSRS